MVIEKRESESNRLKVRKMFLNFEELKKWLLRFGKFLKEANE